MNLPSPSLVIRAGRLVCPATGLDGSGAVAVAADRIVDVALEPSRRASAGGTRRPRA